jgi:ATP-dependent exoDNAse (exonuclease V) beta subunit
MNPRIISAGAGSGKTYRLTAEMTELLRQGVRADGLIATTFTKKAAAELQERVRVRLLEAGMNEQADQLANALIGTVHGLGVKLLQRFAFEAGVSPETSIIADEDQQVLFNQSLANILDRERVSRMERLSERLGLNKRDRYDWRQEVKQLTDIARANAMGPDILEQSKRRSFESFQAFLGPPAPGPEEQFETKLAELLAETASCLEQNADETKKTREAAELLREMQRHLKLRGCLYWHEWAKISKLGVGAKSREDAEELLDFARAHVEHPGFQRDIREFIEGIFDLAIAALEEYSRYKKRRGLIDYTDMEVLVSRLLDNPQVRAVLQAELDLLMVDEFQDTSPIQLDIFLRLSRLARYSVWVGDPKQSIYGFRGAAPELMQAVIAAGGGIRPEDIQGYSWRSRQDIVQAVNALFVKAFPALPPEQVALEPKLTRANDPPELSAALRHWHFKYEGEGRLPGRPWMENCIAFSLKQWLDEGVYILPKGEKQARRAQPGDVAILCRSNAECQVVAEALHQAGLRAAIARSGLIATAEAKLILACLKYILHQYDSLSVAEILLLASGKDIEDIVEDRLEYLDQREEQGWAAGQWAEDDAFIRSLNALRGQTLELSSSEILDLLLEDLDLRRTIATWGKEQQRLDNVEVLRRLAGQYEEACNRLHTAASLGGFLLWLAELENKKLDLQGSGEGPDAVNVLTYHKSKGLEWPIVICHSLEGRLRAEVWGIDLVAEKEEVDLEQVLAGRWLRYWVNPYADQERNTVLEERLKESPAYERARRQALEEEARLLYVGLTRARDYLVLPSRPQPTRWLNRVWHEGQEDLPTLDPDAQESPWEWAGEPLLIHTETFSYPANFQAAAAQAPLVFFLETRAGKQAYDVFDIDLSKDSLAEASRPRSGQVLAYGSPLDWPEGTDLYAAAKAVKAFLIADRAAYPLAERLEMAQGFVQRYELGEAPPEAFLHQGEAWSAWLAQRFPQARFWRKYPVRYLHQGRLFSTVIDLVAETDAGLTIIQNSGFGENDQGKMRQRATQNLGAWCYLSRLALAHEFGKQPVQSWVNFVLNGVLIEVEG